MSDFVRRPLEKRLNRRNIMTRLERVEHAAITATPTQRVDQLRDISPATGDLLQEKERVYVITDSGEERDLGEGNPVPYYRLVPACTDCLHDSVGGLAPYAMSTLAGGGTAASIAGEEGNPGIIRFGNNAATNGGGRIMLDSNTSSILIEGGEVFDCIFRPRSFATQSNYRFGFLDHTGVGAIVDGVYMSAVGDGVVNITPTFTVMNNSSPTSVVHSTLMAADTWYRVRIEIKTDATETYFFLYDSTGLIAEETIVGNLPTLTGRETTVGVVTYRTNNTATSLLDVDRVDFFSLKRYSRP